MSNNPDIRRRAKKTEMSVIITAQLVEECLLHVGRIIA